MKDVLATIISALMFLTGCAADGTVDVLPTEMVEVVEDTRA